MEIAKNSRKRMCGGGCPAKPRTDGVNLRCGERRVLDSQCHYGSRENRLRLRRILLYRCSINECERNGRMCGTVILRNTPASAQLSYLVTVIINNCVNHTVFHIASNLYSCMSILTKNKNNVLTGFICVTLNIE